MQAFDPPLRLAARNEVAQPSHDLPGANRLDRAFVKRLADDGKRLLVGRRLKHVPRRFDIVGDRGERLVELVREAGRQRPHLRHALDMRQHRLQVVNAQLRLLALGQVADEAGEHPVVADPRLADRKLDRERGAVAMPRGQHAADADDPPLAGPEVALQIGIVPLAVGRGHQHAHILAEQLLFRIAEHPFRGRAERQDQAALVDDDHRVGDGVEDRAKVRLAREHIGRSRTDQPVLLVLSHVALRSLPPE